ncbi:MAG: BON domain-containing protein [Armatimonadetes bacterium]|nr:BON domain-containing protein [Armatimonadota bacterium]NIM23460.1 BON domain-containing protein [Armatimonadota bacterium]NIM67325.1 BON domain-containing protein [Armatimonadota bacterium]NIM75823.1 BON domain-containing protein [Armatimonadota bacterium]NIN05511.1 BON domain-containing protein [Armatimonadota bacterium]
MPDWWIALKVRLRLAWEFIDLADRFRIKISCRDGRITLSGSVKNEYRQCKAEEAVRRVAGVVRVTNQLKAREALRFERRRRVLVEPYPVLACETTIEEPPADDRATSRAVLHALSEEGVTTGQGAVRVCAVGRTVYLLGSVCDKATAETAERVALDLPQVSQVRNRLQGAVSNGG